MVCRADALRLPFADRTFDLVIGSPPYCDARLYLEGGTDLGVSRDAPAWVAWMLDVTTEALRVSRGPVIWVAAGVTRDRTYWPACEGLMWEWFRRGGSAYRPCYWKRVGIPGSGGDQWYRADVEYLMCFKRPGSLPYAEPTANGQPPKWAPGGAMSYRAKDGSRKERGEARRAAVEAGVDKTMTPRDSSHWSTEDDRKSWNYVPPEISNPGNVIETTVGGGRLGSSLAHDNEAPFPTGLPAFFIASHSPPGGSVLDPFSGSGTTIDAALGLGRKGYGCDLRQSQCKLTRKRAGNVTPALFA